MAKLGALTPGGAAVYIVKVKFDTDTFGMDFAAYPVSMVNDDKPEAYFYVPNPVTQRFEISESSITVDGGVKQPFPCFGFVGPRDVWIWNVDGDEYDSEGLRQYVADNYA